MGERVTVDLFGSRIMHQSTMPPEANKFHIGNGSDGKHYWLTPWDAPEFVALKEEFGPFDFDPCPFPLPDGFDGLTCEWGQNNYVNPPFGSIMHQGKKKGPTAWVRKSIEEWKKGKRDLTALSQAADYAVDRAYAGTNPVTQLPKRPLRYKPPVFRRPSERSVDLGIACCHGNLAPLARFLLATGMRLMEGATLTRSQIDKRRKVATLTATKNGRARTVSLNSTAMGIIENQEGELLFPAIDRMTGEARVYKQASTNWATAQARAVAKAKEQGWKFERFRLHDLRHMFAIDYLANGGNIYQLQIELGHGSVKQTEWYLQFLSPDEQMQAKFAPSQKGAQAKRFSVADSTKSE